MNKLKKLIVPLVIMVLLIVGLIVFVIVKKNSGGEEEEIDYNVFTVADDQLSKFTVVRKEKPDLVIGVNVDASGLVTYEYLSEDKDPAASYSDSSISSFLKIMCSFYANNLVIKNGNLSEYGLSDPEYKLVYELRDGTSTTILLGHDTYDNVSCYFMIEGSDTVYSIAKIKKSYADYSSLDFLQAQLLDIKYADVTEVQFDRLSDNAHLVATCNTAESSSESGSMFYFVKPFKIKAGSYFSSLMSQIFELEISSYTDIPDDQKAMYGLDNPMYHFGISKKTGEKVELYLSKRIGDYYYGYSNITDKYFVISYLQLSYIDNSITALIDEFVAYYYADEIASVTGNYKDQSFLLEMDVPKDTRMSDDSTVLKLDKRDAKIFSSSGRNYCSVLFEALATIKIDGVDTEAKPAFDSEMTLTFNTKNYVTYKVDFVKRNENSYYVFVDGEYSYFYVNSKELFYNAGQDTYSYGVWDAYLLLKTAIDENIGGIYDIPAN